MLKTLKRKIALVAVAALGAGGLSIVAAPVANAAGLTNATTVTFSSGGTTTAVTAVGGDVTGAAAAQDVIYVRSGTATNTFKVSVANATAADDPVLYLASGTTEPATIAATIDIDQGANVANLTATDATLTTAGGADTAGDAITLTLGAGTSFSNFTFTTGALAAGTYTLFLSDTANLTTNTKNYVIGTITSFNVGAPVTASYDVVGRTKIIASATGGDSSFALSLKDSSARSTFLIGDENVFHEWATVASGITAPQTPDITTAASAPAYTAGTALFTGYTVAVDIDDVDDAGAGTANASANTSYTLNSTILSGLAAFGSASASFRWSNTTAGLKGTLAIQKQSDSSTVTSISLAQAGTVAGGDYNWLLRDDAGRVVEGVTPTASSSLSNTVASAGATSASGTGNAFTYTATTAGTDTISFTIPTGGGTSISTSLTATVTGYGATAPLLAAATVTNATGTGWVAGTAPAYTAGLTVTSFTVKVSGLDAGKVARVATAATDAGAGGALACTASSVAPLANASGVIEFTVTIANGTTDDICGVDVDANGGGDLPAAVTVATVTLKTAAAAITTSPATGTNNFAAPGAKVTISATVADQFSVASPGATVTLANGTVPAGATAQTGATKTVGADGKTSFEAQLGTVIGTYVYTFTAKDYNNGAAGTSTVTFTVTASGAPKTLEITSGVNTATTFYGVLVDADGVVDTDATDAGVADDSSPATPLTTTAKTTTEYKAFTTVVVTVKDDAGVGVQDVTVTAEPGEGVLVNSAAADTVKYSDFNSATVDLTQKTAANGTATFYIAATTPGTAKITFKAGSSSVSGEVRVITNSQLDAPAAIGTGRTIAVDKAAATVNGNVVQVTATVKDIWGNPVAGVTLTGAITGTAGRFTGGARTQAAVASDANGQVVFEVTSNGVEAGTGTLTVTAGEAALPGAIATLISDDLTANGSIFTKTSTKSATTAITVAAGATSAETAAIKADVKAVSDTVKTLSNAVTTIQSSVTELTASFSAQIKSLSSAIAKISRAIAALSKRIK